MFLNIILTLPLILILMYFSRILGIVFLIVYFIIKKPRTLTVPKCILLVGILLYLPKIVVDICNSINYKIAPLSELTELPIFSNISSYALFLIILGLIIYIIQFIWLQITGNVFNFLHNYIQDQEKESAKLAMKNDLEMKEKREKAKNSRVVNCPYCGADNLIYNNVGTCKFCRKKITYQEKN